MKNLISIWIALVTVVSAANVSAQEVTLRAISAFNEGGDISEHFERFVKKVNAEGKGLVQINFVGGPKAMPPFELGKAIKAGIVDMVYGPGAFYTNVMPEALGLTFTTLTAKQQREQGVYEVINQVMGQRMNAYYLARAVDHIPFHIYLNKKIDRLDLKGLRIRVTPVHQDIVAAMGAIPVTLPPGEVYTALERGLVDGYAWPLLGIFDLSWQEKTKYRVDPGFYSTEDSVLVNLNKWNSLNKAQKDFLNKQALWLEGIGEEYFAINEREKKRQLAAGLQVLDFSGPQGDAMQKRAMELGWESVLKTSPVTGKMLKEKLGR